MEVGTEAGTGTEAMAGTEAGAGTEAVGTEAAGTDVVVYSDATPSMIIDMCTVLTRTTQNAIEPSALERREAHVGDASGFATEGISALHYANFVAPPLLKPFPEVAVWVSHKQKPLKCTRAII